MTFQSFLLLNMATYLFSLKVFFKIFKMKYYFPFRYADFYNFLFNLLLFFSFSLIYYPEKTLIILFINLNLFYIFFHLINMIITSPRTKLTIDLKESKKNEINISKYFKKYNCKVIVNNRLKRLKTSKQIVQKKNYIYLIKNKKSFTYIISIVFSLIEKIWCSINYTIKKNLKYWNYNQKWVF